MAKRLYPPLSLIRQDLLGAPIVQKHSERSELETDTITDPAHITMPEFIANLIRRRASLQSLKSNLPVAVGQIRTITAISDAAGNTVRPLGRTCGILLGAHLQHNIWQGWMIAQESEYASDRDLILQEGDGQLGPEAVMVQAWNRVRVRLNGTEPLLGLIHPATLAAVSVLSEGHGVSDDFVPPRPGKIGAWDLMPGMTVVTGTPYASDDDPRLEYQSIYRQLCDEISRATSSQVDVVREQTSIKRGFLIWLDTFLATSAFRYAALALVLLQGFWIFSSQLPAPLPKSEYRNLTTNQKINCSAIVGITFKPDVPISRAIELMRNQGAVIVDGPSEIGTFWISLPSAAAAQSAMPIFRSSNLVLDVITVQNNELMDCKP